MSFISLYFSEKSTSLGYELKEDKVSCNNRVPKAGVKKLSAQMDCAKHCSAYKEFILLNPAECSTCKCFCVDGKCEKSRTKADNPYSVYKITEGNKLLVQNQSEMCLQCLGNN